MKKGVEDAYEEEEAEEETGAKARGDVVSSHARTEMLDRDSSESPSPAGYSLGFTSEMAQAWGLSQEAGETSPWFKVPKFTLKPHSTGFLQITPEGSPQALRRGEDGGEVGGEAGVSGSFCLHSSATGFTAEDSSEQSQVAATQEGTVTMVTKTTTTRTTRHVVSAETRTGEGSVTTTTYRALDYDF